MTDRLSPDLATLLAASEELSSSPRSAEAETNMGYLWGGYDSWCEEHGLVALPSSERTVLLYLCAKRDVWSWKHSAAVRFSIDAKHRVEGHPVPCGTKVGHFLNLRRREGRPSQPKMDALRVTDAERIAFDRELRNVPDPRVTRLRAIAVVALATGLPMWELRGRPAATALGRSAFRVSPDDIRIITATGKRVIIDAVREPQEYEVVVTALQAHPEHESPLREPDHADKAKSNDRDRDCFAAAARRAGLPAHIEAALPTLTRQQGRDFVAQLDPRLVYKARNLAYLLVGLFTARRHADLVRYRIEDIRQSDAGFTLTCRKTKTDPNGRRLHSKTITHLADERPCHAACPACALGNYLRLLGLQNRTSGPVFGVLYRGVWGPMSTIRGAEILKAMWADAGLAADARIGTRSLRAGGATSAIEAGMELWEVALEITDHQTLAMAELYVRTYDPWSFQAPLDL